MLFSKYLINIENLFVVLLYPALESQLPQSYFLKPESKEM